MITIKDRFTAYPGGRFRADGKFSGQEFREDILLPALRSARARHDSVVVNLDGVAGYASSFLEESFGGLVRTHGFSDRELLGGLLTIEAKNPLYRVYKELAARYIRDAQQLERTG